MRNMVNLPFPGSLAIPTSPLLVPPHNNNQVLPQSLIVTAVSADSRSVKGNASEELLVSTPPLLMGNMNSRSNINFHTEKQKSQSAQMSGSTVIQEDMHSISGHVSRLYRPRGVVVDSPGVTQESKAISGDCTDRSYFMSLNKVIRMRPGEFTEI